MVVQFLSGSEVADVMSVFDAPVRCAKLLPGEVRAGDAFRVAWTEGIGLENDPKFFVWVAAVGVEYDGQRAITCVNGHDWLFDHDELIDVVRFAESAGVPREFDFVGGAS